MSAANRALLSALAIGCFGLGLLSGYGRRDCPESQVEPPPCTEWAKEAVRFDSDVPFTDAFEACVRERGLVEQPEVAP